MYYYVQLYVLLLIAYTNAVAMESPSSTMQVENGLYSECDNNKYDVCVKLLHTFNATLITVGFFYNNAQQLWLHRW